ncbi:MAG: class I SAM-dependent methyltransferase [Kouleothrix sp.]|jgi:SAM-dependent methyltransferase|nr:class I SAM-dependent methyltransferase [Kouleothrix sp.]
MSASNSKLYPAHAKLPAYAGLIRWAFAHFYREFAWSYDAVAAAVSAGHWASWVRAVLPYLRGRVLELGPGTGTLQLALAARPAGPAPLGLEASPQMLAITRGKLARAGRPVCLARGLAQALPLAPASVDTVVATFPTEYIIDQATLDEIGRVLRPGGRLVVALAAVFGQAGPYRRLLGLLYRLTLQRAPDQPREPVPRSQLGARLAERGFQVSERWEPVGATAVHLVLAERGS